jgi:hypothetical protein
MQYCVPVSFHCTIILLSVTDWKIYALRIHVYSHIPRNCICALYNAWFCATVYQQKFCVRNSGASMSLQLGVHRAVILTLTQLRTLSILYATYHSKRHSSNIQSIQTNYSLRINVYCYSHFLPEQVTRPSGSHPQRVKRYCAKTK